MMTVKGNNNHKEIRIQLIDSEPVIRLLSTVDAYVLFMTDMAEPYVMFFHIWKSFVSKCSPPVAGLTRFSCPCYHHKYING